MNEAKRAVYDVHMKEFETLKAEQVQRIGFRDNMIYVTLVAVGAIAAYALQDSAQDAVPWLRRHALLLIPWLCVILGWTYVVNDEKISAIGRYIKRTGGLAGRIHELAGGGEENGLLQWESEHSSDNLRMPRKLFQLFVDLMTFVASGGVALHAFYSVPVASPRGRGIVALMIIEGAFLLLLTIAIVVYSGVFQERGKR